MVRVIDTELSEFDRLLRRAHGSVRLTEWEERFVDGLTAKRRRYGPDFTVSDLQIQKLEEIVEKE
ncbi:MAG TPA: hypothetical protein VKA19_03045 [Alphaproteobacteria bacterium]|nr:hypothetical protein [Alphaproteobacteria bacterium]